MDLCSSIITGSLQGNYIFTIYGKIDDVFHLKRPVLVTERTQPDSHLVYVHTGDKAIPKAMFPHSKVHLHSLLMTTSILTDEE